MVFQRPGILLILSYTLTTKFTLKLLRHDKHVQTERKDTLFNRESEGVGLQCGQGSPTGTWRYFYIAELVPQQSEFVPEEG